VRLYFKQLLRFSKNQIEFLSKISELVELIIHEWEINTEDQAKSSYPKIRLMCLRGLMMLLHLE
jgi:hypothetical protein